MARVILEFSLVSDPDGLIQTTARVSDAWAAAHGTAFVVAAQAQGWRVESRPDNGDKVDVTSDDVNVLMQMLQYEDVRPGT